MIRHFTSWWVYPAGAALLIGLTVVLAIGFERDLVNLLIRTTMALCVVAFAYDKRGLRRRRRLNSRRKRGKAPGFWGL